MTFLACVLLQAAAGAVTPQSVSPAPEAHAPRPNVLVLVADDLGTDKVAVYGEHPMPPHTPRIDALAAEGVLFRNAYADPLCSPSRAALLTGRYGRRNGLGAVVRWFGRWELPLAEVTLPELLHGDGGGYATSAVGKWHLSAPHSPSGTHHPNLQGFEHFAGALENLNHGFGKERLGYFHYDKVVDGEVVREDHYATTVTTDDALAALHALHEPWFLYVAYNAPHAPLHVPPDSGLPKSAPQPQKYAAMVERLDTEIGRLLDGLPAEQRARTIVVFLGDNGTLSQAILPPRDRAQGKETLFEGGTNVPLIVAGPCVAKRGSEAKALVHVVDLFPTLAALCGVDATHTGKALDGVSFADVLADPSARGARRFVYTERCEPAGGGPYKLDWRAVRDERYKLVDLDGKRSFYDLEGRFDDGPALATEVVTADGVTADPLEGEARAHYAALEAELARIVREVRFEY